MFGSYFLMLSLDYPIGKVGKDSNGNYLKLDKDVYIMDKVINIPIFKIYE